MPITTRAKRQAQQQSGLPPSPQIVLPETSRRRPRAKKTRKAPEASDTSTTEHVEDPKSEIQALSLSPVAHPVPEVESASPKTGPPNLKLANESTSSIVHPVATRLSDTAAIFASVLQYPSPSTTENPVPAKSPDGLTAQSVSAEILSPPVNILPVPLSTTETPIQSHVSAAELLSIFGNVPPAPPSTPVSPVQRSASLANAAVPGVSPSPASTLRIPAVPQTRLHLWVDAAPEDLSAAEPSNAPSLALAIPSSLVPEILALIAQRPITTSNKLTQTADSGSISLLRRKRKLMDDAEMTRPARRTRFEESKASPPKASRSQRQALSESNGQAKSGLRASDSSLRRTKLQELDRYDNEGNIQLGGPVEVPVDSDDEGFPFSPPFKENRRIKHDYASLEGTMFNNNPYNVDDRPHVPQPGLMEDALFDPFAEEREPQTDRERDSAAGITTLEDQPIPEDRLHPATPRPRKWGLGNILDSARSVSKYIPLLNTRPTTAAPQIAEAPNLVPHRMATPAQPLPQAPPQTEIRPSTHSIESGNLPATEKARPSQRPRSQKPSAKVPLKTKQQVADERKRRAERDFMREQAEFVRLDDARKAQEAQLREDAIRQAEKVATPLRKRKRQPSPDSIPNPSGVSYGMDLDYFGCSSSDEEEEQTTPTKQPPNKKSRISLPDFTPGPVIGDPHRARPYTGIYFADSAEKYHGGNIFGEAASSANATSRAAELEPAAMSLTPNEIAKAAAARAATIGPVREGVQVTEAELMARGYLGNTPRVYIPGPPPSQKTPSITFKVPEPSDSDSDSDPEVPESKVATPTASDAPETTASMGATQASPYGHAGATSSAAPTSTTASGTWTQPPPPPPNPSHAALPAGGMDEDQLTGAIAKARANAMKHAPTKSSSLRQSSRLSSPRVVINNGDKDSFKIKGLAIQESGNAKEQVVAATQQGLPFKERIEVPAAGTADTTEHTSLTTNSDGGADSGEIHVEEAHTTALTKVSHIDETQISARQHTDSDNGTPALTAYAEWRKTADPVVSRLVESTWTEQDTEEAEDGLDEALEEYFATNPPEQEGFVAEVTAQEAGPFILNKGKVAAYDPRPTSEITASGDVGTANSVGAITGTAHGGLMASNYSDKVNAYATFTHTADPAVVDLLENGWTVEDDEEAAASFNEELDTYIAQQAAENATTGPSVTYMIL